MSKTILFSIAFLLVLPFFVFRYGHTRFGVSGYEAGDHRILMHLREVSPSESSFIWKAANFARYRKDCGPYLFRPGLGVDLAVKDYLFSTNFFLLGAFSLIQHALIAILLFFCLRPLVPWWAALLGAVIFEVHFCGSEMIVWRHVSPYAWGLFFYVLGAFALARKKFYWAGLAFFLSTSFQEIFMPTLLGMGALYVIPYFRRLWPITVKQWLAVFWIPFVLSVVFDVGTFVIVKYVLKEAVYAAETKYYNGLFDYVARFAEGFTFMVGVSFTDFLVPQIFSTTMTERRYIVLAFAPIALLLMAYAGKKLIRENQKAPSLIYVLLAAQAIFLCLGYTAMRIIPDDVHGIGRSHYYRYFTNFAFIMMFAAILSRIELKKWAKVGLTVLLVGLISNQIAFGVMRLRRVGKKTDPREYRVAMNMLAASRFLEQHGCFDGNHSPETEVYLPTPFLYRNSCSFLKKGEPYSGERLAQEKVIVLAPAER